MKKHFNDTIYIPDSIQNIVGEKPFYNDNVGMSESKVVIFDDMVLKIGSANKSSLHEATMMQWLEHKLSVPKLLAHVVEADKSYILMSKLQGRIACCDEFLSNPDITVKLLADALKMLWNVDISDCPVSHDLDDTLNEARFRVENGLIDFDSVQPETFSEKGFESPYELLQWLEANKPSIEPCMSHGDFCLPNVFLEYNKVCGFIDLGDSGISDKWRDIALCYRSLKNNLNGFYGKRFTIDFDPDILFKELGITPDRNKLKYWILLDELF